MAFWFCLKRNAAAQRRVLMASLIIPVSLLIISARGQERNPLRLRPTSLYPPPPTLPRRLSSSISLSRQLQYLLRDATSSTRLVHETTPPRIVGPIIANNNEKKKNNVDRLSPRSCLDRGYRRNSSDFFRTFPFFDDIFPHRNRGYRCPFNRDSLFQRFRAPNFSTPSNICIYIYISLLGL